MADPGIQIKFNPINMFESFTYADDRLNYEKSETFLSKDESAKDKTLKIEANTGDNQLLKKLINHLQQSHASSQS